MRHAGRDACAGCQPLLVGLELQAEPVIEDAQVAIATAHDRFRHDVLHFLRHHADIGPGAAVVAEAIEAQAVVEMAEQGDVVLERDIRPASTAATAAAAATTAESTAAATATDAATATAHAAAAAATAPGNPARTTAAAAKTLAAAIGLRAGGTTTGSRARKGRVTSAAAGRAPATAVARLRPILPSAIPSRARS